MNKKLLTICAFTASVSLTASAVTLTSFGSATAPTFAVDAGFTSLGNVQSGTNIFFFGSDNQELVGTFSSLDLTSLSENDLVLSASSVGTAPASQFNIRLFDGDFDTVTYTGGSWASLSGGSATLTFLTETGTFDWSNVSALSLDGGGGGDSVNGTLTGLDIVPEPSAYAAIAGLLALGWVATRRRK